MTHSHESKEEHHQSDVRPEPTQNDAFEKNTFYRGVNAFTKVFDGPATMFRSMIEKTRKDQPYYHRVYKRVPTVDECGHMDHVCIYEANEQYLRDRKVDKFICQILSDRVKECYQKWGILDGAEKCKKLDEDSELAHTNYFIKYGELSVNSNCIDAYMKQKHRLIWQRRNPDKDIVGFDKRKQKLEPLEKYHKATINNPHQNT